MQYAQLTQDGSYSHQITTSGNVLWGPNHFCPASALTPDEATLFRVVPLLETEPPTIDSMTQTVMRDGGELVDGQWQYKWRVDALTPEQIEANRVASIPQSVTMRQASIALELAGLLDDVEAIVATLPRVYQIEWQRASTVSRDNPLVEMVRQQQGMTADQIDALFIAASQI